MPYTPNGHLLGKEMGSGITYKAGKWVSEVALPQVVNGSASDPAPTTLTPAQLTSRKVGALIHPGGKRLNFKAGKWIEEIYDGGWKNASSPPKVTAGTPTPTAPISVGASITMNLQICTGWEAIVKATSALSMINKLSDGVYRLRRGSTTLAHLYISDNTAFIGNTAVYGAAPKYVISYTGYNYIPKGRDFIYTNVGWRCNRNSLHYGTFTWVTSSIVIKRVK